MRFFASLRMTIYGERHLFRWLPCVKGAVAERLRDCFSVTLFFYNPSVTASRATSLYTRGGSFILLHFAVCVNAVLRPTPKVSSSSAAKDLGANQHYKKNDRLWWNDGGSKPPPYIKANDGGGLTAGSENTALHQTLQSRISSVPDGFHHGVISSTFGGFHFAISELSRTLHFRYKRKIRHIPFEICRIL